MFDEIDSTGTLLFHTRFAMGWPRHFLMKKITFIRKHYPAQKWHVLFSENHATSDYGTFNSLANDWYKMFRYSYKTL